MRTAFFKAVCRELTCSVSTKGGHSISRSLVSRCISTHIPLTQEVKEQIAEQTPIDPLEHHDYFDVRKLVTVKKLFLNNAHYGHVSGCRNKFMKPYLFGSRSGIDIFDLDKTVEHFQDALNFAAHIAYRDGVILFVSRNKMMMPFVEKAAKEMGEYAHCRYWSPGIFTNMVKRHGQTIRLPDLVIFLNVNNSVFETHKAVYDCAKLLIPTIGIADSNVDPRLICYPIPANDDTFRAQMYYLSVFEAAIKKAKQMRRQDYMEEVTDL